MPAQLINTPSQDKYKIQQIPTVNPSQPGRVVTTSPSAPINNFNASPRVPRFHGTGPVQIFVRFSNATNNALQAVVGGAGSMSKLGRVGVGSQTPDNFSGPVFALGTCEQFPTQEEDVIYLPVFDDESMSAAPRDKEFAGSKELIILPLNRFNYNVLNNVIAVPRHGRNTPGQQHILPAGQNGHLDRGSLLIGQGLYFEMWLINSYYGSRNWKAYPDMPAGTYYPFCNLLANNTPQQGSGRTQIRMLAVEANWNLYEPEGRWFLKSSDNKYLSQVGS